MRQQRTPSLLNTKGLSRPGMSCSLRSLAQCHAAIPGTTWTLMKDVGHFAMSENPEALLRYLLPILRNI